jgi:hypothetical protein
MNSTIRHNILIILASFRERILVPVENAPGELAPLDVRPVGPVRLYFQVDGIGLSFAHHSRRDAEELVKCGFQGDQDKLHEEGNCNFPNRLIGTAHVSSKDTPTDVRGP